VKQSYHPKVLSPFFFGPSGGKRVRLITLRAIAIAVFAASTAAFLAALIPDVRIAYAWAGPSIFSEVDRRQMSAVRDAVPEGAVLLLAAKPRDVWHARLWQRGMYPRNQVAVQLEPFPADVIRSLRARYGIRYVVMMGSPALDAELLWHRDLGALHGLSDRVSLGELSP